MSQGLYAYGLEECLGPIARENEGVFGCPFSLSLEKGQWLRIPRAACPGLNLHGRQHLTMVAWIKRRSPRPWQFIAGMWDERDRRQYGLFTSGTKQYNCRTDQRYPAQHQPHAYLSDNGGKSKDKEACFSYATGATQLKKDVWHSIAMTWDGDQVRLYCNGKLDTNKDCNPIPFSKPIFNGDKPAMTTSSPWKDLSGSDFTVGQHGHVEWENYPEGSGPPHEGFAGLIGSLCLYNRALPPEEIQLLHQSSGIGIAG